MFVFYSLSKMKLIFKVVGFLLIITFWSNSQAQDTVYYGTDPKYIFYDLPVDFDCGITGSTHGVHSGCGYVELFPMEYVSNNVDSIYGFAVSGSTVFCRDGSTDTTYNRVCIFEYVDDNHIREVASILPETSYRSRFDEYMAFWNPDGSVWNYSFYGSGMGYQPRIGVDNYVYYFSKPYHPTGPFFIGYPWTAGSFETFQYSFRIVMDSSILYEPCRVSGGQFWVFEQDSIVPLAMVMGDDDGYYSTACGQSFYPIVLPPTESDSVPQCAGVDGFRLGVVMDDMAIFYWNQGLSGRYQCSLGPTDSEPEDNALVDFVDGQNFLRYTDLPDGEYKAWVRRVCYHDCYFHRDSTYYSDWSEPIAFRVGDPPDDTVSVRNVPQLSDVTLVPNPATLQVTVTSAERIATVTLTDMSGREVLRREVNAEQAVLDISTLPKGVYLTTIVTPQATTTKRLVVN